MTAPDPNKSELSQRCLKALQDLQVPVDSQDSYSLQLAEWALETLQLAGPWREHQYSLLEQVQGMYGWENPDQFFLDEEDSPPEQTSPESLALALVENLYNRLRKILPALRY